MINNTHTKKDLETLITIMEGYIKELSEWSVHNNDTLTEEVIKLKTTIENIKYDQLI